MYCSVISKYYNVSEDIHSSPVWVKHVCSYSLVQNKVEIKSSKAWRWATLPLVLIWSNVSSSENSQCSTKHEEPGYTAPALRHYSSWRQLRTDQMESKWAVKKQMLWQSWSTLQILSVLPCNIQRTNIPNDSNRLNLMTKAAVRKKARVLWILLHWHALITGLKKQTWKWDEILNSALFVEASACRTFFKISLSLPFSLPTSPSHSLALSDNSMRLAYLGTPAT